MVDRDIRLVNTGGEGDGHGKSKGSEVSLSVMISMSILIGLVGLGIVAWVWSSDWRWAVSGFIGGFFGAMASDLIERIKKGKDKE